MVLLRAGISAHFEVFLDGHAARTHGGLPGTCARPSCTILCAGAMVLIGVPMKSIVPDFGAQQTGDGIQDGALAGAVRADQRDDLAFVDLEGKHP